MSAQIVIAFVFGVAFLISLLTIAIRFPHPTPFQYNVFRIVLSLAAAGAAAMVPGFLTVNVSAATTLAIRSGGALAVFVVVFFFNPAKLVAQQPEAPRSDVHFSVPPGWTFRQVVEALVQSDNSIASYDGFTAAEHTAPVRSYELHTATMIDALLAVRNLTTTTPVRDYAVLFEAPTYHLKVRE